ncbi:MAG: pyrroline-5-carboxylate reductase [Gammaproteobacteria bacterium]|nr:pyrroline-5-carboxylate reductase [Gammaproteobacteria bacterium]
MQTQRIAFIGCGNMARSLIGGLIADGVAPAAISASDPSAEQRQALHNACGIAVHADNRATVANADVVVAAVKPQVLRSVATQLGPLLGPGTLLISIAAGIRVDDMQRWLGSERAIVRAMPNTPALLGSGITGLFASSTTTSAQRESAESILRAVGAVVWLDQESQLDAVTAVSGSGPAYFFLFMEAMATTARELGLSPEVARLLTVETAIGAGRMALETDDDLATLRQHVTSPGGTTAAALAVLDTPQFRQLVSEALHSACARAGELAAEFGKD